MTPGRPTNNGELKYSDHLAIKVTFKGLPKRRVARPTKRKEARWNTNKKGGWDKFKELTSNNKVLEDIAYGSVEDPDEIHRKIEKEIRNIKFKVFGKVRESKLSAPSNRLKELQTQKEQLIGRHEFQEDENQKETLKHIEEEMCKELKSLQGKKMEEKFKKMKEAKKKKGMSAAVFHLREDILGGKKSLEEPAVVRNPATGEEVDTPEEIKKITLQYCK